jgi:predicted GIY-YIG superfamily endonuclease
MKYVYLIESEKVSECRYVGLTDDLKQRFADHNAGRSVHTSQYRPWRLVCYVAFANKRKAMAFEAYLKSGSGHEFRNRHLL